MGQIPRSIERISSYYLIILVVLCFLGTQSARGEVYCNVAAWLSAALMFNNKFHIWRYGKGCCGTNEGLTSVILCCYSSLASFLVLAEKHFATC